MPIGNVFAFSVGDKFHYELALPENPPAVDRITITDKFYSENGDTVYYERYHDSYWTEMEWEPNPHLVYHFYTKYDTLFYYDLDSLLSVYDDYFNCGPQWYYCELNYYYSDQFCNRLINGYRILTKQFEPVTLIKEYGKGLGWVFDYEDTWDINFHVVREQKMFYYQKNGIDCGTPDTITVSTPELKSNQFRIIIFPNPAHENFIVELNSISSPVYFKISDLYGNLIESGRWSEESNKYNCSNLAPGIYLIQTQIRNKVYFQKFVKI